jgi:hypothetical protein
MSQRRHTRIEAKSFSKHVFDIICSDGVQIHIVCAFSHDYNGLAFADLTVLPIMKYKTKCPNKILDNAYNFDSSAHLVFPRHLLWRAFRNKDEISTSTIIA